VVVKGLFGSLKAVKDGASLGLWMVVKGFLFFKGSVAGFRGVHIGGDTEGGCFV
jgi:hypothetical protein